MDDEDDARSQSASQSQSPPPSPPPQAVSVASPAGTHPNGRAMAGPVTVATPAQRTLTLALPIQQPRPAAGAGGGGGGGGREDCWSEGATSALIDAWGERFLELSRGNLKQKQWQEVADAVSSRDDYTKPPKTDVQCKNRIDTLKKKYKLEKSKISGATATATSSWPFFHRLDLLIGPNLKPSPHPPTTTNIKAAAAMPILAQFPQRHRTHHPNHKKRSSSSSSSSKPRGQSPDSSDSYPPETINVNGRRRRADPSAAVRMRGLQELTQAILQFGQVYERVESSKLQKVMEMDKQRMGFARELELQRMEFFMKTQMELSQLKHHHHHNNNSNHHGGSSSSKRKRNSGGTSNNNNINNTNSNSSN